ncbi:hypothetical protein SERLA73DRAFT_174758, partial [Serpula lacrymans var. lacrymans S7.3]
MRGVRKVTPAAWRTYVQAMRPDIVFALTDTPFTPPPYSQKRITKSIERSTAWLMDILRPIQQWDTPQPASKSSSKALPSSTSTAIFSPNASNQRSGPDHPFNVFVTMAGGISIPAREAFSHALVEKAVKPLTRLDDGVAGYVFDLSPLRVALVDSITPTFTQGSNGADKPSEELEQKKVSIDLLSPLMHASLAPLSSDKPRLVTAVSSPHEILRLIRDVGVDVFDAKWA